MGLGVGLCGRAEGVVVAVRDVSYDSWIVLFFREQRRSTNHTKHTKHRTTQYPKIGNGQSGIRNDDIFCGPVIHP